MPVGRSNPGGCHRPGRIGGKGDQGQSGSPRRTDNPARRRTVSRLSGPEQKGTETEQKGTETEQKGTGLAVIAGQMDDCPRPGACPGGGRSVAEADGGLAPGRGSPGPGGPRELALDGSRGPVCRGDYTLLKSHRSPTACQRNSSSKHSKNSTTASSTPRPPPPSWVSADPNSTG